MSELIANRFEVLQPLGSGGLSDVTLVRDRRDGSSRALKRLRQDDTESVERFQSEFAELAALAHPNIVRVHEYGALEDGGRWITMEAIDGRPADQAVRPGDVTGALRVALDAIAGLDALHAAGRFHGDIKPSNLVVSPTRAVLIDFGFMGRAKEMPGGRRRGTPGYLAPEVLSGQAPYGRASDAYALGATLFRILSGRPAFPGRDASAVLAAQSRGAPSTTPLEHAGVPRALVDLILRLLADDPEARVVALDDLRELARRRSARREDSATSVVLATGGPLLGRDTERRSLSVLLLGAGGDLLRIALLAGPVGSGRTRLANEIAIEADLAGWSVERPDAHSSSREPEPVDENSGTGTLVILDDVDEWPDQAIEAFRLPRRAHGPTSVLATARSPRLDDQALLRWVLSVSEDASPRVFELGPLDSSACAELVRARLGGALPTGLVEAIEREASRLPGLIAEAIEKLVQSQTLRQSGSEWILAPGESAEAAVRAVTMLSVPQAHLLEDLSHDARLLLVAIAGGEEPIDETRARERTASSPEAIEAALEELEWRGFVARHGSALRVVPPSLERHALESLNGPGVPAVRKRLIAELEASGTPRSQVRCLLRIGCHAWALGERDRAIDSWKRASDAGVATDRGELSELTRILEARDFEPSDSMMRLLVAVAEQWQRINRPAIAERFWVLASTASPKQGSNIGEFVDRCAVERARCLFMLARYADALVVLDRIFDPNARHSAELRGEALTERGWGHAMLGRVAEARADWDEALRVLPETAVAARAIANHRYSSFLVQWGEFDAARSRLDMALALARTTGDRAIESRVRGNAAQLAANLGRYEDARQEYKRLIPLTRSIPHAFWYPVQLTNLLTIHAQLGDWVSWDETIGEATALARSMGDVALLCATLEARETVAIRRGDLPTAKRVLRSDRAWLRHSGRPDQRAHYRITTGVVRGLAGQVGRAVRALSSTYRAAVTSRHALSLAQSSLALGDLMLRGDRDRRARHWYERTIESGFRAQNLAVLARLGLLRVALRARDQARVATLARELGADLDTAPPLETSAIRAEIRASLAVFEANPDGTRDGYAESIHALESSGLVLRAIETAWEAGRTMTLQGRADDGETFLREAWRMVRGTRIEAWTSRVAIELASRAAGPGAALDSNAPQPEVRGLLARVAELMNSLLDYPVLIQKSLELVARHLEAERGTILLVSSDTQEIRAVGEYGPVTEESQESALSYSRTIVRRVAESGVAFRVDDASTDPRLGSMQSVLDMAVRSVLCTPLRLREELIGTVYLESRSNASQFTEADLELLDSYANLVAIAIDNSRKYESLRRSRERVIGANLSLRNDVGSRYMPANIVGRSLEIERILDEIELVANSRGTVLITGESGTGKELIAKTIHYNSPRRDQPFLSLNCAALPTDLIEAELFGIESHAATGVQGRPGIFERADKGTLFLDEIGDMPTGLQAKLLRVLQEREFVRVGTTGRVVRVDVRLIAATNKDLARLIREGAFRDDLFFRLHALPIHIAPLRERKPDILPLAEHFLRRFCEENGRPVPAITPEFTSSVMNYPWPGNVRELQNYVERAVVMSPGSSLKAIEHIPDFAALAGSARLGAEIPPSRADLSSGESLKDALEEFEARVIRHALESAGWNQRQAARALGLVEPTLRYKMTRLRIQPAPAGRRR